MVGDKNEQLAADVCRMYQQLSGERGTWEGHWQEIAQRVIPSQSDQFTTMQTSKGNKRTEEMYDATASVALDRFASILDSLLSPRNQKWHRLVPNDTVLLKNRQARLWYEEANNVLFKYRYAPTANFSSQNQMVYKSLGAFGSSGMFIDGYDKGKGLRYKNCHLGGLYFVENHQGIVDTVLRKFVFTARQAKQKWGDNIPDGIKNALKVNPEREFEFLHLVQPREDVDPTRLDSKGMPYVSYYISIEGKKFLSEGGYNTFPYPVSRYEQSPNEVYGRSPAMSVLPAIKTLNEQKKTLLKQGHRAVDPVLLVHDDGILDSFSLRPGALNAGGVTPDGRPLVHALPTGNVAVGKDLMDDERALINDTFLVTLFQILTETPTMTATEVLERTREKGMLLAPTIGRQHSEYQGPMVSRELDVLAQQNLLPPMPQILIDAGAEYDVEYDSPMSRAQKAEESSGLMRTVESVLSIVNVTGDPAPLDHFNWDVIVPDISDNNAVPVKWRQSIENVQAIRQQRAKAQQQEQAVNAAPGIAAITKAQAVAAKS